MDTFPGVEFPPGFRLPMQEAMVDAIIDTAFSHDPERLLYGPPRDERVPHLFVYIAGYGILVEEMIFPDGRLDYRARRWLIP